MKKTIGLDSDQAQQREQFLQDLRETREYVRSWPEWKKKQLGSLRQAPVFPPVEQKLQESAG